MRRISATLQCALPEPARPSPHNTCVVRRVPRSGNNAAKREQCSEAELHRSNSVSARSAPYCRHPLHQCPNTAGTLELLHVRHCPCKGCMKPPLPTYVNASAIAVPGDAFGLPDPRIPRCAHQPSRIHADAWTGPKPVYAPPRSRRISPSARITSPTTLSQLPAIC